MSDSIKMKRREAMAGIGGLCLLPVSDNKQEGKKLPEDIPGFVHFGGLWVRITDISAIETWTSTTCAVYRRNCNTRIVAKCTAEQAIEAVRKAVEGSTKEKIAAGEKAVFDEYMCNVFVQRLGLDPNERLMREIEKNIDIPEVLADDFRDKLWQFSKMVNFTIDSDHQLKKAIKIYCANHGVYV